MVDNYGCWIWICDIICCLILWGFNLIKHEFTIEMFLTSHCCLILPFLLLSAQLFSLLDPETSIMNLANHLSGFQDHQTKPWCTRTAQRFVATWDFRNGTIHKDANWNFLCRWIIWSSLVTLAALCATCRIPFDCLVCLEKLKNRRDWALISEFSLYRLFYGNLLASLLLSATTCRYWKRIEMGLGEVDWDRGGDGGARDGCKCGIM